MHLNRFRRLAVFVALLGLSLPGATSAGGASSEADTVASSQWTARPPLRQARGGLGVAMVDGQILAISGFDFDEGLFNLVEGRRSKGSGTWRDLAPLPTARANLATATAGRLVYAVGGFGDVDTLDIVETFNPRSGRWATSLPLPVPRGAAGAAGLGGLLYVAGGEIWLGGDDFRITNSAVVYNPERDTWRSVAPMPTARMRLRLVASGRYLYAIGGEDLAGQSLSTVERYDPRSNSWRVMNPMHESRSVPCAVETMVGDQRVLVVVAGVERVDGTFIDARRTTEVFDPDTGQWTLLDVLLPKVRGSHDCAVEADGTVLAIGGFTNVGGPPFIALADVDALSIKPGDLK